MELYIFITRRRLRGVVAQRKDAKKNKKKSAMIFFKFDEKLFIYSILSFF